MTDATLLEDLRRLIEPATMGDPMRPLLWVSRSHAKLAAELRKMGHVISASSIPKLLVKMKYSRQVNRKTREGSTHPDRNAEFEHINKQAISFQAGSSESLLTPFTRLLGELSRADRDPLRIRIPGGMEQHETRKRSDFDCMSTPTRSLDP